MVEDTNLRGSVVIKQMRLCCMFNSTYLKCYTDISKQLLNSVLTFFKFLLVEVK